MIIRGEFLGRHEGGRSLPSEHRSQFNAMSTLVQQQNDAHSGRRWPVAGGRSLLLLLVALLVPMFAFGQVDQGAITGVVSDITGAVIPGANVTLSSPDTGLTLQTRSNQSGNYTFSPLKIGNYSVTVSVKGFQTLARQNLHVDAEQRLEADLRLTPGEVSQTITVTTDAPLLQTETSAVLKVPSAVVPFAHNFLFNPAHPAADAVQIVDALHVKHDDRILKLLTRG